MSKKRGSWLPNAAQKKQSVQSLINQVRKQFAETEQKKEKQRRKEASKKRKNKIRRYTNLDEPRRRTRIREGRPKEFQEALVHFWDSDADFPYVKGKGYIKAYIDNYMIPYLESDEYKQAVKDLSSNGEITLPHENPHLALYQQYKSIYEDKEYPDQDRKEAFRLMFNEAYAVANNKMTIPEIVNRLEYLKASKKEILDAIKNIEAFKNATNEEKINAFFGLYRKAKELNPKEYESSKIMDILLSDEIEEVYDQGKAAINPELFAKAMEARKLEDDAVQREIDRAYDEKKKSELESKYVQKTERYKFLNNPNTKIDDIVDITAQEFRQLTGNQAKVNTVIIGKTLGLFNTVRELKAAKGLIENTTRLFPEFRSKPTHGYDMFAKAKELNNDENLNEARREILLRQWLREFNSKKSQEDFVEAVSLVKR